MLDDLLHACYACYGSITRISYAYNKRDTHCLGLPMLADPQREAGGRSRGEILLLLTVRGQRTAASGFRLQKDTMQSIL